MGLAIYYVHIVCDCMWRVNKRDDALTARRLHAETGGDIVTGENELSKQLGW